MVVGESNMDSREAACGGESSVLSEYWSEESFMKKRRLRFAGWETNTSSGDVDLDGSSRHLMRICIRDPALAHCLNTSLLS